MHPQLQSIVTGLESAKIRLHALAEMYDDESWRRRPAAESWSAAECVAHLNLTSEAYLRILPEALERARALGGPPPKRFRRDFQGWLVGAFSGPKPTIRVKTSAPFIPSADQTKDVLIAEFDRLQEAQVDCVLAADGLPIHKVRVVSPFAANVGYSLYSALYLIPGHQHRHLGQAERAVAEGGPSPGEKRAE